MKNWHGTQSPVSNSAESNTKCFSACGNTTEASCWIKTYGIFISKILRNRRPVYILFREGNGTPLQYSCLENPMDGGAWWAAVHGVPKSRTRLSDFTLTFHFHALEKEMVTHSSVLSWRTPGMAEPGGLPSLGVHRVGHDWSDLRAAAAYLFLKPSNYV